MLRQSRTRAAARRAACGLTALCIGGCGQPVATPQQAAPAPPPVGPTVSIDRSDNGAAVQTAAYDASPEWATPRRLSFVMAGIAHLDPKGASVESRAAAAQTAIVIALGRAVVESRLHRGEIESDFSVNLGPGLSLTRSIVEGNEQFELRFESAGQVSTFVVRDGRSSSPPQDLKTIRQIFEATGGEFGLLGTEPDPLRGTVIAKVAHYAAVDRDTALAGDAADEKLPTP